MFPFICGEDFILVKRVPLHAITPGDTILFESEDKMKVCHIVSAINTIDGILWFHTKGYKSMPFVASPIRQDRVLGKAVALKRKNKVIDLTGVDMHSFRFHFNCFWVEYIFYARSVLAKIPGLKKIYRYITGQMNVSCHRTDAQRANLENAVEQKLSL